MRGSRGWLAAGLVAAGLVGLVAVGQPVSGGGSSSSAAPAVVPIAKIYTLPGGEGSLSADEIDKFLADPANHEPIVPELPPGHLKIDIPADNPLTKAKAELGRMLYFDKRLSRDHTVSCASCHDPAKGWADAAPVSTGIKDQKGGRSAPTVMNRAFGKPHQFWDGRAASLEEQALGPIQNPIEMGFTLPELMERLKGIEGYRKFFDKVFGEVSDKAVAKAIASFERTVLVGGSKWDYFTRAEAAAKLTEDELEDLPAARKAEIQKLLADAKANALSESAERGRKLYFGKAECSLCHVGTNLTDDDFYNIGVGMTAAKPDAGRMDHTKNEADFGAFKTPSLRNIAQTAPYMHDGSEKTLLQTVEFYNKGGNPNRNLHKRIRKLNLTEAEMKDLVVFLEEGLTGPLPNIPAPRLP
jgi:cytochrome c peroxidase